MAELEPDHRWAEKSQKIKGPREQLVLSIINLVQILHLLANHQYAGTDYYKLGLYLGLLPRTLDIIAKDHTGDVSSCLEQCLKAWLRQVDDVKNTCGPTYYSLIKALRNINQIAVADGIDKEKHPACAIFARYCEFDQFMVTSMDSLPCLAILLHKEKIIVDPIVPKEASALLIEVKEAICAHYRNLKKFIFILMKLNNEPVTSIADSMLKEYENVFTNNEFIMIPTERDVKVNLPLEINEEFTKIRNEFGKLLVNVAKAMEGTVNFENLKMYVSFPNKHLRPKLALCQCTYDIVELIGDHCSLIDIALLEGIVDEFKVDQAKAAMQIYKDKIEKFYEEIPLHRCLNEQLASFSPLQCETAFITVDQNTEDYKLKDIQILMTAVFQRLATHIQSLIATALENIEVLIERNIQKLVIGYCTLYNRNQTIKECEGKDVKQYITSSEFYSSVYSSKSTIEQLLVSQSIQILSLRNEVLDYKTEMEYFRKELEERMQQVEHFKKKAEEKTQEAEKYMESVQSLNTLKKKLCYENDRLKADVDVRHESLSMENQKKRTEIKLEAVLNEKQEIETKLHNKRENEEKHQPDQQQILHDDLEKENQRLKNVLRKYEDRLKSPGTAKDLELLTAKVEELEEEKKALRNDCDKYCKDNEQLRKQMESFYTGQMSQGPSSVEAMLQENMKRMERDREYLKRQLDNAEREADDLRKKAEQKKKDDSKIQEMIRKEKNFKTERERLEHEIDDLKFTNKKLEEQLKQEESKIIETERDFDKMNTKRKKGVSFCIPNDEPQSILKKGSYTDERERIDDESIPASTPTYEDLMKMKEEIGKLQSGLMSLEKDNRRREKENQTIEEY